MRKYLPTFAELIDRLSIVNLKSIKIHENKEAYEKEAKDIMDDLDLLIKEKNIKLTGQMIRAIIMVATTNEMIWSNEAKARLGTNEQNDLLRLTHSINGVRNLAKNVISNEIGERVDLKLDALAADLCREKGYDFGGIFDET